jgi:hypothetical protein
MRPPQRPPSPQKEGRLSLASQSLQRRQIKSQRRAAKLFSIPRSTLYNHLQGSQPQATANAQKRKLHPVEEQSLVQWILDLDQRGFPPQVINVRRMADALLAARGQNPPFQPVGKNWVLRFINSQSELQTKWNRKFHSHRAKCEDSVAITAWFKLVEEMRQAYGILDDDVYNFDETGFMMGVASMSKVVTSTDTVGRAVVVQLGNCDWVMTIECINASGWCIPPFVILSGKLHQASWYQHLPPDWVVAVSDNGWTTDELGVEWVRHFNRHTASCMHGVYRLLILDGHSSHSTPEFDQYCTENNIITLCMPPHTSHLLQLLDVSCFSPLKHAYGHKIQELARQGVYYIDKIDFDTIYTQIWLRVFTEQNIKAGFEATVLIPYCLHCVLSPLTVVQTPSPPATTADNVA